MAQQVFPHLSNQCVLAVGEDGRLRVGMLASCIMDNGKMWASLAICSEVKLAEDLADKWWGLDAFLAEDDPENFDEQVEFGPRTLAVAFPATELHLCNSVLQGRLLNGPMPVE